MGQRLIHGLKKENLIKISYNISNKNKAFVFGVRKECEIVGNSVVRHRITRLVRESYRLNEALFERGLDIVVVARPGAKGRNYFEIESALLHLGRIHKIVK